MTENRYDKQIALIVFIVAKRHKVSAEEILSKGRKAKVVEARYTAMNITEQLFGGIISLKEISAYFGKQDHSRVIHAREHLQDKHDTIKGYTAYFNNTSLLCKKAVGKLEKFMERKQVKIKGYEFLKPYNNEKLMKTIIIAGITRSGTTAIMQMLHAGGYPCFGTYPAFEDYEMGKIPFKENIGKAFKIIDTHLQFPPSGEYYVIRLRRNHKQQAQSIGKFLNAMVGVPVTASMVKKIEKSIAPDLKKIDTWAKKQKGFIIVDFEDIIEKPMAVGHVITNFIGCELDVEKMAAVIEKRTTNCYDGLLEAKFCTE